MSVGFTGTRQPTKRNRTASFATRQIKKFQQQRNIKMTKSEKIQVVMIHNKSVTFDDLEALPESVLDQMIAQIRATVAQREAEQARVNLELVTAGLRNLESNFSKIKNKIGAFYSVEQVRKLIDSDEQFEKSLVWDDVPFKQARAQEQADVVDEQARRSQFSATAKALTAQGIKNVADNDANYRICMDQLDDLLVSGSASTLSEAIALGLINGLAPNDPGTVQDLDQKSRAGLLQSIQSRLNPLSPYASTVRRKILSESTYAELRERSELCSELADNFSPSASENANYFCSIFAAVKTNQEYRQQLDQVRQRKRLANLEPWQIREENQRVRQVDTTINRIETQVTPDGFKILRPESRYKGQEITMKTVSRMDREDVKQLLRLYGRQALDLRLLETRGF
jgi:hypothetical protein